MLLDWQKPSVYGVMNTLYRSTGNSVFYDLICMNYEGYILGV